MGKIYIAILPDGRRRSVAQFSNRRPKLFFDVAKILEHYIEIPCGIREDDGPHGPQDEHEIDANQFICFFRQMWRIGWLSDISNSFVSSWASWAAGIVENITLTPVCWIDRDGVELLIRRYQLDDASLEEQLKQKKQCGEVATVRSEINNTDFTV